LSWFASAASFLLFFKNVLKAGVFAPNISNVFPALAFCSSINNMLLKWLAPQAGKIDQISTVNGKASGQDIPISHLDSPLYYLWKMLFFKPSN